MKFVRTAWGLIAIYDGSMKLVRTAWGLDAIYDGYVIYVIAIKKISANRGRERAIYALSVRRPQPHNTNAYRTLEEKGKTVKNQEGAMSNCFRIVTLDAVIK